MNLVRLLPVLLSFLLLAAHFSRNDVAALVVVSLALPTVLLLRRPWVPRLFQGLLVLAALEWVRTLIMHALRRQAEDEPWTRLAIILGIVALFTLCSGLVFRNSKLRQRYSPA